MPCIFSLGPHKVAREVDYGVHIITDAWVLVHCNREFTDRKKVLSIYLEEKA